MSYKLFQVEHNVEIPKRNHQLKHREEQIVKALLKLIEVGDSIVLPYSYDVVKRVADKMAIQITGRYVSKSDHRYWKIK